MIEIIKAAFTAGEVKTFLIQGEYIEILEAAYPVDVAMMDRSGAQLSTMRNAEASYFSRPGKYEVIQVTSSQAQTVRLFVGSGDAGTRRTSGDVSVVDGEKSRTLAGGMFAGSSNAAGVAAQYSACQLWNPTGSGKNIIVTTLSLSSNVVNGALIYLSTAGGVFAIDQTVSRAGNKLSGAAIGVAQVRIDSSASLPVVQVIRSYNLASNANQDWVIKGAIVVKPNAGLNIFGASLNSQIVTNFEWFEETI